MLDAPLHYAHAFLAVESDLAFLEYLSLRVAHRVQTIRDPLLVKAEIMCS